MVGTAAGAFIGVALTEGMRNAILKNLRGTESMRDRSAFIPNMNLWWWQTGSGARVRAAS